MNLFMTVGSQSGSHRPVLDSLSLCSCLAIKIKREEGGAKPERRRAYTRRAIEKLAYWVVGWRCLVHSCFLPSAPAR